MTQPAAGQQQDRARTTDDPFSHAIEQTSSWSNDDLSVLPAVWKLEPKNQRTARAWLECGRVELGSIESARAFSGGDVVTLPIGRASAELGVVVANRLDAGSAERDVLWVSRCRQSELDVRAEELRVLSMLKQLS